MNQVPFTEEDVKVYLDSCIMNWRQKRDSSEIDSEEYIMATHYVDAFQSIRVSIFGELLLDQHIGEPYSDSAREWSGGEGKATMPPERGTIGNPNRK